MKDREPIQVTAGEAEGEYHIRFPRKYHDMLEGYARRRHADLPDAIAERLLRAGRRLAGWRVHATRSASSGCSSR